MIEEFAVANMYIGEYLKHNNDILQIRIFEVVMQVFCKKKYKTIDENMYKQLIKNNITAEYTEKFRTHDMIACDKMYTHFTSPIRRFQIVYAIFIEVHIFLKKVIKHSKSIYEPEPKNMIQEVHLSKQTK